MLLLTLAVSLAPPAADAKSRGSESGYNRQRLAQNNGDQYKHSKDEKRSEEQSKKYSDAHISRDQAAAIARDATAGRVLKVELKGNTYHVKVLLAGERVRTVRIDARTGQVRG
jgi:uncharacterized membrane protein YkoI